MKRITKPYVFRPLPSQTRFPMTALRRQPSHKVTSNAPRRLAKVHRVHSYRLRGTEGLRRFDQQGVGKHIQDGGEVRLPQPQPSLSPAPQLSRPKSPHSIQPTGLCPPSSHGKQWTSSRLRDPLTSFVRPTSGHVS